MCETVKPKAWAISLNLGIGGKPGRSTFLGGNLAGGVRGTAVLCAHNVSVDAELRSTKKIASAQNRER